MTPRAAMSISSQRLPDIMMKYAACRFAPADMNLFADHRQRLFLPVLNAADPVGRKWRDQPG
jgi:hypothetical protein